MPKHNIYKATFSERKSVIIYPANHLKEALRKAKQYEKKFNDTLNERQTSFGVERELLSVELIKQKSKDKSPMQQEEVNKRVNL